MRPEADIERKIQTQKILSKDATYPCQYCKRNSTCVTAKCVKWQTWFKAEWAAIRKYFEKI